MKSEQKAKQKPMGSIKNGHEAISSRALKTKAKQDSTMFAATKPATTAPKRSMIFLIRRIAVANIWLISARRGVVSVECFSAKLQRSGFVARRCSESGTGASADGAAAPAGEGLLGDERGFTMKIACRRRLRRACAEEVSGWS